MSVFVELLGKTKITCSNGAEAELEYVPVGTFHRLVFFYTM